MDKKIILMGIQGCGKGTQAEKLVTDFGTTLIGAGDIFRWLIKSSTTYGRRMKEYLAAGQLVPDSLVLEVIEQRLNLHDWDCGMILDGFPRSDAQRAWLFEEKKYQIDTVLHLEIANEDIVVERMLARGRSDDNETAIRTRLAEYRKETEPTLEWFEKEGLLKTVDAIGSVDEVYGRILSAIGESVPAK